MNGKGIDMEINVLKELVRRAIAGTEKALTATTNGNAFWTEIGNLNALTSVMAALEGDVSELETLAGEEVQVQPGSTPCGFRRKHA